jgi:hypothetical protein
VREEIADGDRSLRGTSFPDTVFRVEGRDHLPVFESRHVFRDRIVELEVTRLDERQHRDRSDGLRHRRDAEQRVARHSHVARHVPLSERAQVPDAVRTDDENASRHRSLSLLK